MRMLLLAVVAVILVAEGCGMEKERARQRDQEFSAARLSGRFKADDPLVKMLSGSERDAMVRAGMMEAPDPDDPDYLAEGEEGDEDGEGDDEKSAQEQASDAVMSVLVVGVTLGMMAAPYLLF